MIFRKKIKCNNCRTKISEKFSFCPHCGENLMDEEKHMRDYGLLGKGEELTTTQDNLGLGITEKFLGSLMSTLIKNLDKQFKGIDKEFKKAEIKSYPNGIRIRMGAQMQNPNSKQKILFQKNISKEQLERMSSLPRSIAETKIKRLNDKVIYELNTPGIESPEDIFISKLESGYEIKAIGSKKVYVNSLPVNLPLKSLSLVDGKLLVEFRTF